MFSLLAKFKGLRGGALDVFGYGEERRIERGLIVEFSADLDRIIADLNGGNHATAVAIVALVDKIRGFGHVKLAAIEAYRLQREQQFKRFSGDQLPFFEVTSVA